MRKEDIVARLEELTARKRAIDEEARTLVREFLEDRGPDGVSFTDNPAYALVEGCDCWFEDHVYGVRLRDGMLEVSLETACGEGGHRAVNSEQCCGDRNLIHIAPHFVSGSGSGSSLRRRSSFHSGSILSA